MQLNMTNMKQLFGPANKKKKKKKKTPLFKEGST